ncbi:hypothetical protein T459_20333 [Capsicum annuum]|uniref:Uncharacterized protein n=1 Tax=Capsicum annuum TaxID=4072 RepID=A0A2G2Z4H1_CAPAN|nr:putative mitochondrial 37S ribosomal protein S27-like [Capsicum annuum]PHT76811.1 hypothetical protein T459_20333 [Capsicum annuum]
MHQSFVKEDGFLGSYFKAIPMSLGYQKKIHCSILVKDDFSGPLEEVVTLPELRPVLPEIEVNEFNLCDRVDAFDNDGWWVGMVTAKIGRRYYDYAGESEENIDTMIMLGEFRGNINIMMIPSESGGNISTMMMSGEFRGNIDTMLMPYESGGNVDVMMMLVNLKEVMIL